METVKTMKKVKELREETKKTSLPQPRMPASLVILLLILASRVALAQAPDPNTGKQLLRDFAGSDNSFGLLKHPKVWPQLQRLLGSQLAHLQDNLNVSGSVDVDGGDLTVRGNAPHKGTQEEAAVCINTYNLDVSAAILSQGTITVYSHAGSYSDLSRCIKDWVTLANSERRDLTTQPKNVRMAGGK